VTPIHKGIKIYERFGIHARTHIHTHPHPFDCKHTNLVSHMIHTHTHSHTHTHTHTHNIVQVPRSQVKLWEYTCTYTHKHTNTRAHTHTLSHIDAIKHRHASTYIHTHTHTHTHTHSHSDPLIYTHIYIDYCHSSECET